MKRIPNAFANPVGKGAYGSMSPGADCVSAISDDFLPTRNGRLGPWVVLQELRSTLAEFGAADRHLLAGASHPL